MGDKKWCPQHGYPLPCDKCGMPLTQQKVMEAKDEIIHIATSNLLILLANKKQAGQREVVEWIKNNSLMMCQGIPNMTNVQILSSAWQAQLKKWGL